MVEERFAEEELPEGFSAEVGRLLISATSDREEHTMVQLRQIGAPAVDPLCRTLDDPGRHTGTVRHRGRVRECPARCGRTHLWRGGSRRCRPGHRLELQQQVPGQDFLTIEPFLQARSPVALEIADLRVGGPPLLHSPAGQGCWGDLGDVRRVGRFRLGFLLSSWPWDRKPPVR